MDFGALPPEVNSGRMYSGAGPGPMLAAAAAWHGLAAELHTASAAYGSVIADLAGNWNGPSSESMAAAATPYAEWLSVTAQHAEQSGTQAATAAAAYETAFAATVPPPVIAANRSLLVSLVATNILAQNTLAIAATEGHYAEMWAQDAASMYGYAGSAATATQLTGFAPPPETANQGAAGAAAASTSSGSTLAGQVSQLISLVPNALQQVTAGAATTPAVSGVQSWLSSLSTFLAALGGPYSPFGIVANFGTPWLSAMQFVAFGGNVPGFLSLLSGAPAITGALGPLSGGMVSWEAPIAGSAGAVPGVVTVSATAGQAGAIGGLSVPASWTSTAPGAKLAAAAMPSGAAGATSMVAADGSAGMFSDMALSSLAGRAIGGGAMRSVVAGGVRVLDKAPDTESLTTATILVIPISED